MNTNLTRADLSGADLRGVGVLGGCFKNARLINADLRGVRFWKTDWKGLLFSYDDGTGRADLRGADLWTAKNLTAQQIKAATTDETTRLPRNLFAGNEPSASAASQPLVIDEQSSVPDGPPALPAKLQK